MLTLEYLCKQINIPEEVTQNIIKIDKSLDYSTIQTGLDKLFHSSTWSEGLNDLKNYFVNCKIPSINSEGNKINTSQETDPDGFIMLTCMLKATLTTYQNYREIGINEEIFYDTISCFTRFVNEHKVSYDSYGFDREWWTYRQIAMELFRIGELEYEFKRKEDNNRISIHIPSDAKLTKINCSESLSLAKAFFHKHYSDFQYDYFTCHSWLLSPNLKNILEPDSNIIQFQDAFQITDFNPDTNEFMEWVFKNPNLSLDEVPQNTSLQRKLKAYLINGGKIGEGFGYLKSNAFSD